MRVIRFIKKNTVFLIAALAAVITCFFVPPDKAYLDYFDWTTLACLFLTLAVICALRNIKFFTIVARRLVLFAGNLRSLFFVLIIITFIGSMIIANDMALITFLPLGYFAISVAKQEKYIPYLFILQNISANLGGMLTPFGNPQNLYLYSFFKIPTMEFCSIMLPPFILAVALLSICCLFVKPIKLTIGDKFPEKLSVKRTLLYSALFLFAILIVFRVIPFWIGLIVVPLTLFFVDREALLMVDYALLGTFFFFFIFAGNLARIDAVNTLLSSLLQKDTLLVSVASCQGISNVPSAILLSRFTTNYKALLMGVNIGGTGTLIASLASLITFSEHRILYPGHTKQYFWLFTLINTVFLVIMTAAAKFLFL
ncbi:MAG: SLC13 family permease [Acutalibacteraceae bacterium]|nr:SLC13 family permease [Acutalibacteraceae bacterium]